MSEEKTDFQAAFNAGREQSIISQVIEGVEHVLIPPNCELKNLERLMAAPKRIVSKPIFSDIPSFNNYTTEFKEDGTRIFVDEESWNFSTVFDFHKKDEPKWGDHTAELQLNLSPEWKRFKNLDNDRMEPMKFAELIEDNIHLINTTGEISGADLLTMAQTFKIDVKGVVEVEESLSHGLKTLIVKDESTVRAQGQDGRTISFPEKLQFNLRIFKNQERFPIDVFLRMRKSEKALTFWIKIPDAENIEEQAFERVLDEIKTTTGLPCLLGSLERKAPSRGY